VLSAARRHVVEPSMVRVRDGWAVVGRPEEGGGWAGLSVHEVDEQARVWWCGGVVQRALRRDVVNGLTEA
jgi:hypothetical protein